MNPKDFYQRDIEAGYVQADPEQERVLEKFQQLQSRLIPYLDQFNQPKGFWSRILSRRSALEAPPGLYLYGGVGRGKTYLMDLFFESLPTPFKQRTHFHRFMQQIHEALRRLQGSSDPLREVAAELARQTRVLCFDEFFVLDIGDAMILAGLLQALVDEGVVLIATSNTEPDRLYENGLQRSRFLSAIQLIKATNEVVRFGEGPDFRLRHLQQARLYYCPHETGTDELLQQEFQDLAPHSPDDHAVNQVAVAILGREIPVRRAHDDVAWFDFAMLCDGPRSSADYVELARLFHALIVSEVPHFDDGRHDQLRRFINLVDALYDHRVKLLLSAANPIGDLYGGGALDADFQRTHSRLIEMQSEAYLKAEHRP